MQLLNQNLEPWKKNKESKERTEMNFQRRWIRLFRFCMRIGLPNGSIPSASADIDNNIGGSSAHFSQCIWLACGTCQESGIFWRH